MCIANCVWPATCVLAGESVCISIQESFSLWEAQKWLKIVTKGDSAMFIYRLKVSDFYRLCIKI